MMNAINQNRHSFLKTATCEHIPDPGARLTAICDVDRSHMDIALKPCPAGMKTLFKRKNRARFFLLFVICCCSKLMAGNCVYEKLFPELDRYAIVYEHYSETNFPVMSGNAAIGGLFDPLGRGVCNIEMNDLYLDEAARVIGPGMMLKMAQFVGLRPTAYQQRYDLKTGVLTTKVDYSEGAYQSEMFFSHADRELFVYTIENKGKNHLECNIDLGRYEMNIDHYSDNSVSCISREGSFSMLYYTLFSNISFGRTNYPHPSFLPWSKDIFLTIPAGQKLEITVRLQVDSNRDAHLHPVAENSELLREHLLSWEENWRSMGFVILPEGDYAKTYYRSLHWLQCTSGVGKNFPGECQFGVFSTYLANEYNFRYTQKHPNITPWQQRPFTGGGPGWSILAYTWYGDKKRAGEMLSGFYRPESLKKNVLSIFPLGEYEFTYGGKSKGKYMYLSEDNPDAICFAHENFFDGRNIPTPPFDLQIGDQGFGTAMYHHYNKFYGLLEDTVYAVLRGSAEFWRTILNYDIAQKSYTLPPLLSASENLFEPGILDGLLVARWTLAAAAQMAEKRDTDKSLRKEWLDMSRKIRIEEKNDIYLEYTGDDGKREGAGYSGIRAHFYLGFPTLELMKDLSAKKVSKSLDLCWLRNKKGEGMITFTANCFALADAYWGRAEEAYEKSVYCLTQTEPHTSAMCEQNQFLYYFLTGYASFTMVPVAMVLQSVEDEIRVFPAVPKAFADIAFYNLPATEGIRVSGVMKDGTPQKVVFEKDGKTLFETTKANFTGISLKHLRQLHRSVKK